MDKYMLVLALTMSVFTSTVTAAATGQSIDGTHKHNAEERAKTIMTDRRTCRLPGGQLATKRMRFKSERGVAIPQGVEAIPLPAHLQLAGAEVKISTCD